MSEISLRDPIFVTAAMADILLSQNLVDEARQVIEQLEKRNYDKKKLGELYARLEEISKPGEPAEMNSIGVDRVRFEIIDGVVWVEWEATREGLELAKRRVRYSGKQIVRIFRAILGPRGVRTSSFDVNAPFESGRVELTGLPHSCVCVAAVGFLSNTGEFVPLASTEPVQVSI